MKDHIETEEERRIRQYEALSPEQKAMIFQKISTSFETDTPLGDVKKLAEKALRAAERAKKPSTKIEHLAEGYRKLSQARDEATVLFLGLMQSGETPDPAVYWQYHSQTTVLMNRLELFGDELKHKASDDNEGKEPEVRSSTKESTTPERLFPASGYFDVEEASRYTGLSKSTLYHDDTVPCYKAGEKLVFVKAELDAWLLARPRRSRKGS